MKSDDLLAIVDFLYRGEANVFQENLDSFLAIAEELQLKGLMENTEENVKDVQIEEKYMPSTRPPAMNTNTKIPKSSVERSKIPNSRENTTLAIPSTFSGDLEELEERVKSMMEKSQNKLASGHQLADRCKVCGKEGKNIKDHIEANHLEGIIIPCNLCDKTFRSRNSLRHHILLHRKNNIKTN